MSLNGPINDSTQVPDPDEQSLKAILIVDDNPHILRFMESLLGFRGYQVFSTPSPSEALLICQAQSDGLRMAIVDYSVSSEVHSNLPAKLRALAPRMKIVLTSGLPEADCTPADSLPAYDAFLPKPFLPAELISTVQRYYPANHS